MACNSVREGLQEDLPERVYGQGQAEQTRRMSTGGRRGQPAPMAFGKHACSFRLMHSRRQPALFSAANSSRASAMHFAYRKRIPSCLGLRVNHSKQRSHELRHHVHHATPYSVACCNGQHSLGILAFWSNRMPTATPAALPAALSGWGLQPGQQQ